MLNTQIISTFIGIFAGLGIMVGGCGYAYSSWKNGKNKYKDDIIEDLKTTLQIKETEISRLNQEKSTIIASHQKQLTELQRDFGELKVRFEEQNKKLEEYKQILQDRDPHTLETLTEIKQGIIEMIGHQLEAKISSKEAAEKVKIVAEKLAKEN